jgi:hypothetical protein
MTKEEIIEAIRVLAQLLATTPTEALCGQIEKKLETLIELL